jgi:hypothetical protein
VNPQVQSVDAGVEPLSPDVESVDAGDELGNGNLQSAAANGQPANPKVVNFVSPDLRVW